MIIPIIKKEKMRKKCAYIEVIKVKTEFSVEGMMCAACASHVEGAVRRLAGVEEVSVSLLTNTMTVTHGIDPEEIARAVSRAGYPTKVFEKTERGRSASVEALLAPKKESRRALFRTLTAALLAAILFIICMGHMVGMPLPAFMHQAKAPAVFLSVQALLALFVILLHFAYFRRGFAALLRRSPSMDTLVALGSGASFLHGCVTLLLVLLGRLDAHAHVYFEASATILALVGIGKLLEGRQKDKTADAVRALSALSPKKTAILDENGCETVIDTDALEVGAKVVLRAGERVPCDGHVLSGHGTADESALTGESLPIDKSVGDTLSAGSMIADGHLILCADRVGAETSLAESVRMVAEAASGKAPIARMADRVSAVFVPAVLGIALLSFALFLAFTQNLSLALSHGVCVLVISCPCALGLATPVAIMTATGRAAELGILVKSAESLEALGHVRAVAFDKTGTLTEGHMSLFGYTLSEGVTLEEAASILYALEASSSHPIGQALATHFADYRGKKAEDFSVLPGKGVYAKIDGRKCMAGNLALFRDDLELDLDHLMPAFDEMTKAGATPLFLSVGMRVIGVFAVSDSLREEAPEAVRELQRMGIHQAMLTGDCEGAARYIGARAGIEDVHAALTPDMKAAEIEKLKKAYGTVCMVGDGINDALPLVSADVSMAIGAGTDVAAASADVILRKSSPADAVLALRLGRATLRNVRQNLFWALIYNALCIPVAAGALYPLGISLSPMLAALSMSFSSLFVVTNALRLKRFK